MTEAKEELDKLVRKEFGLGEAESPNLIHHASDKRLPQFAFEWHVGSQKVYRIDIPGQWMDNKFIPADSGNAKGYCIAEHALTHAQFYGFVQTFCRGYLLALVHHYQKTLNSYVPEKIKETDSCPVR
jgi:hypothetical protein